MWSLITIQESPEIVRVIVESDNTPIKLTDNLTAWGTLFAVIVSIIISIFSFYQAHRIQKNEHKHSVRLLEINNKKELLYKKIDVHDNFRAFLHAEYIKDKRHNVLNDTLILFLNQHYSFLSEEVQEKLNRYNKEIYEGINELKSKDRLMPRNKRKKEQDAIIQLMEADYEKLKKELNT
ncbi:hypothetical protein IRY55_02595 [Savagea sp. SN6]|uniref:Uncharacterized protein n=1 Tax=Savagea serpentis TaxID=2785297 RepID=A0A8J7GI73_9BACL|nr:hypothetical protein [Savagea serpentis]MBF4500240.1 hypothetical protein [Savagea serpentis]